MTKHVLPNLLLCRQNWTQPQMVEAELARCQWEVQQLQRAQDKRCSVVLLQRMSLPDFSAGFKVLFVDVMLCYVLSK